MSLEKQFPTALKVNKDSALIHDSETKTDGLTTDYLRETNVNLEDKMSQQ